MDGHPIERELQNLFPASSSVDWKKIAMQETEGKDPFEILSWRGKDNILFLPYYDAEIDRESRLLNACQSAAANDKDNRTWLNLPSVQALDAQAANKLALEHLMQGADGVIFNLVNHADPDLNRLTNNIEWPHCYIGFYLNDDTKTFAQLTRLLQTKSISSTSKGTLFWESIPKRNNLELFLQHHAHFKSLGLVIPAGSPAEEISEALIRGLTAYEKNAANGNDEAVFRSVCFSVSTDHSFLESVAKIKALRMLWFQIARACHQRNYEPHELRIHARTAVVADGNFGPHENMLNSTYAAMAAIFGGCDSLTVETEGTAPFLQRWSRNVSPILKEESFLGQAADPLAGAYAVNAITEKIAEKAWKLFQHKWRTYAAP